MEVGFMFERGSIWRSRRIDVDDFGTGIYIKWL